MSRSRSPTSLSHARPAPPRHAPPRPALVLTARASGRRAATDTLSSLVTPNYSPNRTTLPQRCVRSVWATDRRSNQRLYRAPVLEGVFQTRRFGGPSFCCFKHLSERYGADFAVQGKHNIQFDAFHKPSTGIEVFKSKAWDRQGSTTALRR